MSKPKNIPYSKIQEISASGIFVKHFGQYGEGRMKEYAHRDDYYIFAMLTEGSAAIEIDFQRVEINAREILIGLPQQVHRRPRGETWDAEGWLIAMSPEMLTEQELNIIEEATVASHVVRPEWGTTEDMNVLCSMLERYRGQSGVAVALAKAVKSMAFSALGSLEGELPGRYRTITLRLRRLLDSHLAEEKRPSAYAAMLNISEVYLNEAVKGATGMSVGAYVRSRVVTQARRMLVYTSQSSKEIAYALGYDDYAYFSKMFKKATGKSPSDYRKNLK